MALLDLPTTTSTAIACTALSNKRLLQLAAETDAIAVGRVDGECVPRSLARQVQDFLTGIQSGQIDEELIADDQSHGPLEMLQVLRQQLRVNGRSVVAGTTIRAEPHSDKVVLVVGFPCGIVNQAEVCCDL